MSSEKESANADLTDPDLVDAPSASHGGERDPKSTPRWCAHCETDVVPVGGGTCGVCPLCRRYIRGSGARKDPANELRRDQIRNALIAEYRPQTMMLRNTCEDLAAVREQIERVKPRSTDYARLSKRSDELYAMLEASRVSEPRAEQRMTVIREVINGDQDQIAALRGTAVARSLLEPQASRDEATPDRQEDRPAGEGEAKPGLENAVPGPVTEAGIQREPASLEPEPARCSYCHQPPAKCDELRSTRLSDWRRLHRFDPEEITRVSDEATATMLATIRRRP